MTPPTRPLSARSAERAEAEPPPPPATDRPSDHDLLAAVARGDRAALGALFRRHYGQVHRTCYRMTGDRATADDLAQETFLRVLRYAASFEHRAAPRTWLYRIVRNVCLAHFESERRRGARLAPLADPDAVATRAVDPRLATLRAAFYRLAPDKRELIVLSRYHGMSYAEIAEVVGTTAGAVKVRAHRAMRALRRHFEELEKEA